MTDALDRLRSALADRYTIQRELGRGGMATVYLADDRKHGRPVAIKVLHQDLAAGLGTERFLREVATAARLHHPHILALYDSGEAAGLLYYVMPYVEGESLRDRLDRETQLPVEEALQITRDVAGALQYAHDHDVLHRDIKPDNIMLESGHAMVADFGVARAVTEAGAETLTSTGLAVGTPTYMSPEQAAAEKTLDGRSDLYSLGCLLYEMLAGEPPHTGPTAQAILARRLSEVAPSLRAVREHVPESVHQALARALARAPADRFGTVAQFAEALEREIPKPATPTASRRRGWTIAGVATVVLAVVGSLLLRRDPSRQPAVTVGAAPGVAVLPFQTTGDDIAYLGEGMAHLLAFNFDGVTGVRKIDPQAVLYAWGQIVGGEDQVPPPGAFLETARRIDARYAVTGNAVLLGDEIRLNAEVHDVSQGQSRGSASIAGPVADISRLIDGLTLELLRQGLIPTDDTLPSVNLSRVTTTSLEALKAYLAGEREYRRAHYDRAARDFSRALEIDSTFARAMFRLAVAYAWMGEDELGRDYATKASLLAAGLPERDSLLLLGGRYSIAAIPPLQLLTTKYPDDVDGWYALGESLLHFGGIVFAPAEDYRRAFEAATELAPSYGESYIHLIEDAFAHLDSARALELVTAYQALDPDDPPCPGYQVIAHLRWGDSTQRAAARSLLATRPTHDLLDCAWVTVAASQETLEAAEQADLAMIDGPDWHERMAKLFRMLQARVMNGQFTAAYRVAREAGSNPLVEANAAHFAILFHLSGFPDTSQARWATEVMTRTGTHDDHFWLGAEAIADRRWADLARAQDALRADAEAIESGAVQLQSAYAGYARANAEALGYFADLVRGDWAQLSAFEDAQSRMAPWGFRSETPVVYLRYQVGRMLFDAGRLREAEKYLRTFYPYQWMYLVPAQYYLGRIYQEQGRLEDAAERYGLFVEWWRDADPALREWWEDGRTRLAQVSGEPRPLQPPE